MDSAVALVKTFAQLYPPSALGGPQKKPLFRSTRTRLVGGRPLVRLFSDLEVPDDNVPPSLTFTELEVLHHKLVVANRQQDIGYLKWLCVSYGSALRARRDAIMHARPASESEKDPSPQDVQEGEQ